eukprot:CAMPEP_0175148252 /NCGR_PEP_ID=MMETSP0087-20121206/16509_1 /TAXON_ID=136419 /ORGANISM="Unknown Unknown, Strain D1" /LENGTH=435 /DNA_ID=CAMNT_0016433661 /DNA_START=98 /DNA_END=1405 /DNA_ORIENTATION=-
MAGSLQLFLPLIMDGLEYIAPSGYSYITVGPQLSKVMFSGEPWLVMCKNSSMDLPPIWVPTSKALFESKNPDAFSLGVLDCDAPLPSGQNSFDRFKLKRPLAIGRTSNAAFYVANGKKPQMIPSQYFMSNRRDPQSAQSLVNYVAGRVNPFRKAVTDSYALTKFCFQSPQCVLMLHYGPMKPHEVDEMSQLMKYHRLMKFVGINIQKYSLSLQHHLPPLEGLEGDAQLEALRVLYFKRRKPLPKQKIVVAAKAHRGGFTFSEITSFLEDVSNSTGTSATPLNRLKKLPTIKKGDWKKLSQVKPKPKSKPKQPKKASKPSESKKKPQKKTEAERKQEQRRKAERKREERARERKNKAREEATRKTPEDEAAAAEQAQKEQRAKEARRREQMDRERESHLAQEADENVPDQEQEDSEEEQVLDLDNEDDNGDDSGEL